MVGLDVLGVYDEGALAVVDAFLEFYWLKV
jgi:hypothetical protein